MFYWKNPCPCNSFDHFASLGRLSQSLSPLYGRLRLGCVRSVSWRNLVSFETRGALISKPRRHCLNLSFFVPAVLSFAHLDSSIASTFPEPIVRAAVWGYEFDSIIQSEGYGDSCELSDKMGDLVASERRCRLSSKQISRLQSQAIELTQMSLLQNALNLHMQTQRFRLCLECRVAQKS